MKKNNTKNVVRSGSLEKVYCTSCNTFLGYDDEYIEKRLCAKCKKSEQ